MARPTKTGLEYFPLDVGFLRDKKVRLLRAEYGASSVVFVLYVLCKVYEGDGYYLTWDKDELLIAADELRESPQYISEVLQGCLSRSIFDSGVFQMFGVLTSAGIQRRYLRSCEKRDEIQIINRYWLLNIGEKKDVPASIRDKVAFIGVFGGKNPVNSPENPVNSHGNPQSKVKESKVKESISPPTPHGGIGGDYPKYKPEWFERFWVLYPKHEKRIATITEWDKLRPNRKLCDIMANAIRRQAKMVSWQKEGGRYIPCADAWLRGKRWEDEITQITEHSFDLDEIKQKMIENSGG